MKKIFYLASIAALAFSSCAKDDTANVVLNTKSGGMTISASAGSDDATTRNYLGQVGDEIVPLWSVTDVIAAYSDGTADEGVFHQNVPFAINPEHKGRVVADFVNLENGMQLMGGKNLFFYYPYNRMAPKSNAALWAGRDDLGDNEINPEAVDFIEVASQQGYMDGSFISNMAPSVGVVSTSDVTVNGDAAQAEVSMQPVVDYLAFKVMGPEPIAKLTLKLGKFNGYDEDGSYAEPSEWFAINGEGVLKAYVLNPDKKQFTGDESVRYLWEATAGDEAIETTIEPGTMTDLECHDVNTYVFVVPGGILGMGLNEDGDGKVVAQITAESADADATETWYFGGESLNGGYLGVDSNGEPTDYFARKDIFGASDEAGTTRSDAEGKEESIPETDIRMENMFFFANPMVDTDGDKKVDTRSTAIFNPNNDFLIHDAFDWLIYFTEYADAKYRDNEDSAFGRDGYVCPNVPGAAYETRTSVDNPFDFTHDRMSDEATYYNRPALAHYRDNLNEYIDQYMAFGLPSIGSWNDAQTKFTPGVYENEFHGNGIVITGVDTDPNGTRTILGMKGVFSDLGEGAVVEGITFKQIVANSETVKATHHPITGEKLYKEATKFSYEGSIVAGDASKGTIKDVVVDECQGLDAIQKGNAKNYLGLSIYDASDLTHIMTKIYLGSNLDMTKSWEQAINTKSETVFHFVDAAEGTQGHYVVSMPATADYANLAQEVYVDRTDMKAVSTLIGEVSYWTGDNINTAKLVPVSATAMGRMVEFAEQLAWGKIGQDNLIDYYVTRDMNLNYENNEISWPARVDYELGSATVTDKTGKKIPVYYGLNGQGHTVTGLVLEFVPSVIVGQPRTATEGDDKDLLNGMPYAKNAGNIEYSAAPFVVNAISNITFNGINVDIETAQNIAETNQMKAVPGYVAGVAVTANSVANVKVTDLSITAHEGPKSHNKDAYYANIDPYIGWLVATADNVKIENSSVANTFADIDGLAGIVGLAEINSTSDITILNTTTTYNSAIEMTAITEFTEYDSKVYQDNYGNPVGLVVNKDGNFPTRGIKVQGCGTPAFLYDAQYPIYFYGDTGADNKTFKNEE